MPSLAITVAFYFITKYVITTKLQDLPGSDKLMGMIVIIPNHKFSEEMLKFIQEN